MAEVLLRVAGRVHLVACRDGEEHELEALGARLEKHADIASRAAGAQGGERTMLFIALMLADELSEAEQRPSGNGAPPAALERIAERLESIAELLEKPASDA